MGVETELLGLKNRYDGKEFRVIEREDGTIAVLAGDVVIADSGVTPVTVVHSGSGAEFRVIEREDGTVAVLAGDTVIVDSGVLPVTAVHSGSETDLRGIAPSGTVAADGTITLGTALPTTFAQIMLYLPAGAISGGSAGFYAVEMSSTTVGVVRERFGDAALVGSGSAYTGVTTEVTAYSWPITAGELGKRRIESALIHPNNANVKSFRLRFGTAQCALASGANNTSSVLNVYIQRLKAGVQITTNAGATGASGVMAITTVDDSTEQSLSITMQLATATDYCIAVLCNQMTGM